MIIATFLMKYLQNCVELKLYWEKLVEMAQNSFSEDKGVKSDLKKNHTATSH